MKPIIKNGEVYFNIAEHSSVRLGIALKRLISVTNCEVKYSDIIGIRKSELLAIPNFGNKSYAEYLELKSKIIASYESSNIVTELDESKRMAQFRQDVSVFAEQLILHSRGEISIADSYEIAERVVAKRYEYTQNA